MSRVHFNNFSTTLAAAFSDTDTSITLTDNLPSIGAGNYVRLTLVSGAQVEIIEIDDNTGAPTYDVAARSLEGTGAHDWLEGDTIQCRFTKGSVDDKQDALSGNALDSAATPEDTDYMLYQDVSDSSKLKRKPIADILALGGGGGGGSFSLIEAKTASSSAQLDFYDLPDCAAVMFLLEGIVPATNGAILYLRTSDDAGTSPTFDTADYSQGMHGFSTASHQASGSTSTDSIQLAASGLGLGVGNGEGQSLNATIHCFNPLATNYTYFRAVVAYLNQDTIPSVYDITGCRKALAATRAVRFYFGSGNITSGTIYAYALAKA